MDVLRDVCRGLGLRHPQREALIRLSDALDVSELGDLTGEPAEIAHCFQQLCGWKRNREWLAEFDYGLATSVGKSLLAEASVELLVRAGFSKTFLVVGHRRLLQRRWLERLQECRPASPIERLRKDFGCVVVEGAGEAIGLEDQPLVVVQTIQSVGSPTADWARSPLTGMDLREVLRSRGDLVVIFDEAHHLGRSDNAAWLDDLAVLEPRLLIGLTATPTEVRHVLYDYGLAELLQDGAYSKSVRFVVDENDLCDSAAEQSAIETGLTLLKKKKEALAQLAPSVRLKFPDAWRPVMLIATDSIAHAKVVAASLVEDHGMSEESVFRVTSDRADERDLAVLVDLDSLRPEVEVVVAAYMLDEGWDVTCVSVICPVRALNSPTNAKQILGRGLRLPAGQRLDDDELDYLEVVSVGQRSLSDLKSEIDEVYGRSAIIRRLGDGTGGQAPGAVDDDPERGAAHQWQINATGLCDLEIVPLAPAGLLVDWDALNLSEVVGGVAQIRIEASSGQMDEVVQDPSDVGPASLPLWEQLRLRIPFLSAVESRTLAGVLREDGIAGEEESTLPFAHLQQVQDEVERVSQYRWGSLSGVDGESLVSESVIASSKFAAGEERQATSGWDSPAKSGRRWYRGFLKSSQDLVRFDSEPEFQLVQALETQEQVEWWYRNDPALLTIETPSGRHHPDFVIGVRGSVVLLEVKGDHLLDAFQSRVGLVRTAEEWCRTQTTLLGREVKYLVVPGSRVTAFVAGLVH